MKIAGWHGGPRKIVGSFRPSPSSEGTGVYISENRELAEYFGHPHAVEANVRHPLIVDHEDLPGLEGHLMRGWFEHMRPSVWISANYEASKACGLLDLEYDEDPEAYLEALNHCFPDALTAVLRASGYDSVKVSLYAGRVPDQIKIPAEIREQDVTWWVVFDPKKVKFRRERR
jgi:hypothetical protein